MTPQERMREIMMLNRCIDTLRAYNIISYADASDLRDVIDEVIQ